MAATVSKSEVAITTNNAAVAESIGLLNINLLQLSNMCSQGY